MSQVFLLSILFSIGSESEDDSQFINFRESFMDFMDEIGD